MDTSGTKTQQLYPNSPNDPRDNTSFTATFKSVARRVISWEGLASVIVIIWVAYLFGSGEPSFGIQITAISPSVATGFQATNTFSGSGDNDTAAFQVGNIWELNWTCDPSSDKANLYSIEPGTIEIGVYKADSDLEDDPYGEPLDAAAVNATCQKGKTSGTKIEYTGGNVFLSIGTGGNWTATIGEPE